MRREWDKHYLYSVFCHVVELGSFSKAAERLEVANSSISKAITKLEQHLDKKLLYRTTRSLSPTDEGQLVYQRAKELIDGFKSIEHELEKISDCTKGTLRITFPNTVGRMIFSEICNAFLLENPNFELELIFTSDFMDMIEDDIDIAFRTWHTLPDSQFYVTELLEIKLLFVAAPSYLEKFKTPTTVAELEAHNILLTRHSHLENAWLDEDGKRFSLGGNLIANSRFHIREAALSGIGIGMLPSYFCEQDLSSGRLIELLPDIPRQHKTLGALYKSKRASSKKIDLFLSFVERNLAQILE